MWYEPFCMGLIKGCCLVSNDVCSQVCLSWRDQRDQRNEPGAEKDGGVQWLYRFSTAKSLILHLFLLLLYWTLWPTSLSAQVPHYYYLSHSDAKLQFLYKYLDPKKLRFLKENCFRFQNLYFNLWILKIRLPKNFDLN